MSWRPFAAISLAVIFALGSPAAEARQRQAARKSSVAKPWVENSELQYLASHFRVLSPNAQIAVVQALRDFMSAWEYANSKDYAGVSPELRERMDALLRQWTSLVEMEACAAVGYNCIFGGWPSKSSDRKCMSPKTGNAEYQRLAQDAGCEKDGFLCSPALFGSKLCLGPEKQVAYNSNKTVNAEKTRDLIRSTYQSCNAEAAKRKFEDIVRGIAGDPDAFAMIEATSQTVDAVCQNQEHFQFGSSMCASARERVARIGKEFFKQFPDQIAGGQCYFELDAIRKCSVPLPDWAAPAELTTRDWQDYKAKEGNPKYWGCGYFQTISGSNFSGIMAFRDPRSDVVFLRSPGRAWFQGNRFGLTQHYLYKMPGARLHGADQPDGARDVEQLAGVLPRDIAALDYFEHPATFNEVYGAQLNEITLQIKERATEYQEATKAAPNPDLKRDLAAAIQGCASVQNADFQKARAEACQAIGLPIADCKPAAPRATSNGARAN